MRASGNEDWPDLPYAQWKDTCAALHLWTQIVGKIRLASTPWLNHSWHVTLYVTPRGLGTGPMAFGTHLFEIDFDFLDHVVVASTSDGQSRSVPLRPQSVAAFHDRLFAALADLGIAVRINERPNELPDPIPFPLDRAERPYDPEYARRFWRVLVQVDRVLKLFRTGFCGKCSPVHMFWGSLDLATTRFSGRRAPQHPGGIPNLPDRVTREAYSHEVSSAGFWPGGGPVDYAAFYSYAYPAPPGFASAKVKPAEAFFDTTAGEFLLPYDVVRTATDPDRTLLDFLQSTYDAAADLADWDRWALDRPLGRRGMPGDTF